MSYCTQQDLITRYGEEELLQLTDKEGVGQIDTDAVDRAIADADGDIDGYLAKYNPPINPVPKVINRIACDIARYYLYDDAATELVEKRYENAVRFLQRVADGKVSLGVDAAGASPQSDDAATMQTAGHVFGRDDNGFI